ncbi:MAG: archaea-specific SMC-related protein, partial [Halanaeroarchaeum sp.]
IDAPKTTPSGPGTSGPLPSSPDQHTYATMGHDDADGLAELTGTDDVTADLDPSSRQVACWTCGSTVRQGDIESRIEELRSVVATKRTTLEDVESTIEDTLADLQAVESVDERRAEIESRLAEIERQQSTIADEQSSYRDEIAAARDRVESLQADVEETEELRESDLLEAYQDLNDLEFRRGQIAQQLDAVKSKLAEMDDLREERDDRAAEVEAVRSTLTSLRSKVADRERAVVSAFNDHMADVLELLQYENVERVWIERKVPADGTDEIREGTFELHIVRESDGTVYDDDIEHLSQSEREVVGLMVALAGYLTHDVPETVPFLLVDSVEAIDSDRLVALVEYMASYAVYVIVALLPEDAAAFPEDYRYVTQEQLSIDG